MSVYKNVIIVGAGFSGIAAARVLHLANIPFILLEARDRLGGRTHTQKINDTAYIELGGQWIGATQERIYALAKEHGIEWFETYNKGKNIIDLNKKIREYTGLIPKMDLLSLINIEWVIRKLEAMAKKMDVQEPWSHPRANEFDAQSLDAFVKAKCFRADAYKILSAGLETVFACMLNEISLLHALFYIRSGSSLNILLSIEKGAQQHRLKGGMQNLAEQMAKAFAHQIKYNHAVTKITQEKNKVIVAGERFSYEADKVILAVPPVLLADMAFHPPLPKDKIQVIEKIFMGNVGKVFGVYAKPFWRDKGFSGQVVADELGPFQTLFDLSPADGSCGILLAFCLAGRAEDFFSKSEAKRKEIATQYFQKYFGEEANQMLSYHDHTWRDETWSRGCFAGIYPPNTWTNHQNALAAVYGNIHWAGTETADVWYGYIEGAVRAGERAAKEILSSI